VPIGLIALVGVLLFLPETKREPGKRLDWFGFVTLALGVGAFQMMLDRGERQDWFEATEILVLAAVAVLGLYLFVAHTLTAPRAPFLDPRLLLARGFTLGLGFVFIYGMITVPPMVLMPTFMQDLRGMPVDTIGLLQSPRGVGLVVSMFAGSMLTHILGPRILIGFGFACLGVSCWEMSTWNLQVGAWPIVWTGFLQGIGGGIIWVPLQAVVFAELPPAQRTEAASVMNLARSIGSSIGVSIALTMLTRSAASARAGLVEHVTPYSEALRWSDIARTWDLGSLAGLARLEREVELQAAMMGYVADFKWLAAAALLALPLIFLIRRSRGSSASVQPAGEA
jgi:DHA2 family multidrug resistance protein